jgi:branched-chain amino acid transport system ATP-binding protein
VIVLDAGRLLAEGPPAIIRDDPRVLEAYMGGAPDDPESGDRAPGDAPASARV